MEYKDTSLSNGEWIKKYKLQFSCSIFAKRLELGLFQQEICPHRLMFLSSEKITIRGFSQFNSELSTVFHLREHLILEVRSKDQSQALSTKTGSRIRHTQGPAHNANFPLYISQFTKTFFNHHIWIWQLLSFLDTLLPFTKTDKFD